MRYSRTIGDAAACSDTVDAVCDLKYGSEHVPDYANADGIQNTLIRLDANVPRVKGVHASDVDLVSNHGSE